MIAKIKERLHKYLARCGIASRRKAEEMIRQGRVSVNGSPRITPGVMIDPAVDIVTVDGEAITSHPEYIYYALHKPEGYLSTVRDPHGGKKIIDLVPGDTRVYPAGRLDKNSSGLMILTNDGALTNILTHPSFEHEKEYEVIAEWSAKMAGAEALRRLKQLEKGVLLEDGMTSPAIVTLEKLDSQGVLFHITLKEGRKRQVRRMCGAIGLEVRKLKRVRIGKLLLGDLLPGEYRRVFREEII